jgi:hypothetical protein
MYSMFHAISCSTVRNFDMLYNTQYLETFGTFIIIIITDQPALERSWGPLVRQLPVPHGLSAEADCDSEHSAD